MKTKAEVLKQVTLLLLADWVNIHKWLRYNNKATSEKRYLAILRNHLKL